MASVVGHPDLLSEGTTMIPVVKAGTIANAEQNEGAHEEQAIDFKKQEQAREKRRWTQQLSRTMKYLGLSDRPSPDNVIFVCIDMEAYEFNQNRITEIGVSILDTQAVRGTRPDPQAKGWEQFINTRHIRIKECQHLANSRHVQGCPDYFDFGESEWIFQQNIIKFLTNVFIQAQQYKDEQTILPVLVGHNIESDIQYMMKSGFDVLAHISDCIDTQDLNKVARRDSKSRGLGSLLMDYRIPADHLHNAGNDAHYTLRLLLAIAEAEYSWPRSADDWNKEMHRLIKREVELAEAKVRNQYEGWSLDGHDVEGEGETAELDRLRKRKVQAQSSEPEHYGMPSRGRGGGRRRGRGDENVPFRGRGRGRGGQSYREPDKPVAQAMATYGTGYGQFPPMPAPASQRERKNHWKTPRGEKELSSKVFEAPLRPKPSN